MNEWFSEAELYAENVTSNGLGLLAFIALMTLLGIIIMLIRRQNGKH